MPTSKSRKNQDRKKQWKKEEKKLKKAEKKLKSIEAEKTNTDLLQFTDELESTISPEGLLLLNENEGPKIPCFANPETSAGASANDGPTLDLLSLCRKSIGEWQILDLYQSLLLNVETNVSIMQQDGEFNMCNEMAHNDDTGDITQNKFAIDLTRIPKQLVDSLTCTRLTVGELHKIDDNGKDKNERNNVIEIQNLNSWIQSVLASTNPTMLKTGMEPFKNVDVLEKLSMKSIEQNYWNLKFQHRAPTIASAILQLIPYLYRFLEYRFWILPNGDKVPLEFLQLGVVEVIPEYKYLVRLMRFYESGELVDDKETGKIPEVLPYPCDADITRKITIHELDPQKGPIYTHYVLEVPLPNGETYIIDPTSLQFNYRGPNGTVIMHGEWKQYSKGFPGCVVKKFMSHTNDIQDVALQNYFRHQAIMIGNGSLRLVERLKANIIKYFNCRSCYYCGQVEKLHTNDLVDKSHYKFVNVKLFNCSRCRAVAYCGKDCQKFDWNNHKVNCKSGGVVEHK